MRGIEDGFAEPILRERIFVRIAKDAGLYLQAPCAERGDEIPGDETIPESGQIRISVRTGDE